MKQTILTLLVLSACNPNEKSTTTLKEILETESKVPQYPPSVSFKNYIENKLWMKSPHIIKATNSDGTLYVSNDESLNVNDLLIPLNFFDAPAIYQVTQKENHRLRIELKTSLENPPLFQINDIFSKVTIVDGSQEGSHGVELQNQEQIVALFSPSGFSRKLNLTIQSSKNPKLLLITNQKIDLNLEARGFGDGNGALVYLFSPQTEICDDSKLIALGRGQHGKCIWKNFNLNLKEDP